MIKFIGRRLGLGIFLIFIVTAITFFLTRAANIPIARNILGPGATAGQVAIENRKLGLAAPVAQQYIEWVGHALTGDLGKSYFTGDLVTDDLASRLPVTLSVVIVAALITLIVSVLLGVASAVRGGVLDRVLQAISTIAYIFPGIILAIGFVFLFAITLQWVPATGFVALSDSPGGWFGSIILPAIVLTIGGTAALAAQIRGSMIDELNKDYIRTLRSRGFSQRSILLKHALRNAAGPGLTTFSLQFITLFGASLFIEKIFALPGYGTYAFNSTLNSDLPAMMGVTLFGVGLVVIVNLIVDLASGWLNPKARQL